MGFVCVYQHADLSRRNEVDDVARSRRGRRVACPPSTVSPEAIRLHRFVWARRLSQFCCSGLAFVKNAGREHCVAAVDADPQVNKAIMTISIVLPGYAGDYSRLPKGASLVSGLRLMGPWA